MSKDPKSLNEDNHFFNKNYIVNLFLEGINAVRPKKVLPKFIKVLKNKNLVFSNLDINNENIERILPICIGKASVEMAKTYNQIIGKSKKISIESLKGILVANEENFRDVSGFHCFISGHPIPNQNGLIASKFIRETIFDLGEKDLILLMLSGGGSAMLPDPPDGITLEEKIIVNQRLLECGANIKEINAVRKHLSKLKGGNFLKYSFPAKTYSLIISDVVGDDLSSISSGLTAPDPFKFSDVIKICSEYKILDKLPNSVKKYFDRGLNDKNLETPKPKNKIFKNCENKIIASNNLSLDAIKNYFKSSNNVLDKKINCEIWKRNIEGDVKDIALKFVNFIKSNNLTKKKIFLSGGETTVKISGTGKGGRNQELALYFSVFMKDLLPNQRYLFLSGGTDGRDGPTDSAGGIVSHKTLDLCLQKNINIEQELKNNNSYSVLKKIDSHILIQGTNTNVADIQILILI